MREIKLGDVGSKLKELLLEAHPIDEDIGVLEDNGELLGVIITPEAYEFFLRKVEEEEDRLDAETVREFDQSGEKDQ